MQNRTGWILTLAALLAAQDDRQAILRPVHRSILPPGPVEIIARTEAVTLDGKPLVDTNPAKGVFTAKVSLPEGKHVIAAGAELAEVWVTRNPAAAPEGFKPFRDHPPGAAGCSACHSSKTGSWALKTETAGEACLACHDAGKFPRTHTHAPNVLEQCQSCHRPHGSTDFFHLKFSKATACKLCHG